MGGFANKCGIRVGHDLYKSHVEGSDGEQRLGEGRRGSVIWDGFGIILKMNW